MLCGIHQPQFIPWIGYFNKIAIADRFVLLDNVQYKKNEYQNRNRIRTAQGWMWLTVPVSFRFGDTLQQTAVADDPRWRRKTEQALKTNYSAAPFFASCAEPFIQLIHQPWPSLAELNSAVVRWMCGVFKLHTPLENASDLEPLPQEPTERLAALCEKTGCDAYLSGKDGPHYMDLSVFEARNLGLKLQHFEHPEYPQQFAERGGFEPFMSALDLLFNLGPEESSAIIQRSGKAVSGTVKSSR
jgi:hypothetical protein